MTKYDEQFKRKLVEQCLSGKVGPKSVAQAHGLSHSQLRRWVAAYRSHGAAGLRKKFSHYDAEFRYAVLQRLWHDELSYTQVATLFDIRSPASIGVWERRYHAGGVDALASKPRGRSKKMAAPVPPKPAVSVDDAQRSREELLAELEYLRAENDYLKKLDALIQEKKLAAQKKRGGLAPPLRTGCLT